MRTMTEQEQTWCIQITSVGYIFPGSPLAPGREHQRVSGSDPQHADTLRYQSRCGKSVLKVRQVTQWGKKTNKQKKGMDRMEHTWSDHQTSLHAPRRCLSTRIQSRAPVWRSCEARTSWMVGWWSRSGPAPPPDTWQSGDYQVELDREGKWK